MQNKLFRFLSAWFVALLFVQTAWSYDLERYNGQPITWNPGTVTMQVQLGAATPLSDGSTFNSSVQTAMQMWNAQLGTLQFSSQVAAVSAPIDHNGVNEIGFDTTVYGTAFDSNVLAVTMYYFSTTPRADGTYRETQADIIFNSNVSSIAWDSYRGPLRVADDIQRVALHELGHVLGLDHPDEASPPQNVTAVMNSHIGNLDGLASDDITGAQLLYGVPSVAPAITGQPANQTVYAGQNASFSVSVSGSPAPTYQWQRLPTGSDTWVDISNAGAYSGTGTATLSITSATTVMNGDQFRCVVTNAIGSAASNWAVITVASGSPIITSQPTQQTRYSVETAQFTVAASGNPPPIFQWQRLPVGSNTWSDLSNAGIYSGTGTTTLSVAGPSISMNGDQFRCVITNSVGSATSDSALLNVLPGSPIAGICQVAPFLFLRSDGKLSGFGSSVRIGNHPEAPQESGLYLTPVELAANVAAIASGGTQSLWITSDRSLWGKVGVYSGNIASDVVAVSAGVGHILFIKKDGTLWAMGDNFYGQLGDGTTVARSIPVMITNDVIAVAAGGLHSLFLKKDSTLWAMGDNASGQLGDGAYGRRMIPVQIATDVAKIAAGYQHSVFITRNGSLWGMGDTSQGRLPAYTYIHQSFPVQFATDVISVCGGHMQTFFIRSDHSLWGMGGNQVGTVGDGTGKDVLIPIQIAAGVVSVASGDSTSIFSKTDGSVWTMGYYAVGDGTTLNRLSPVQIGSGFLSAPIAPVNLSVTNQGGNSDNRLAWNLSIGATSYEVWRNTTNNSASATRIGNNVSIALYYDLTAISGTPYYYWIKAVNGAGASSFSDSGPSTLPPTNAIITITVQ